MKPGVSVPWPDEDVMTLLCHLNFRIHDIRSAFRTDDKEGILFACNLLSRAIGNDCTSTRVERKIRQLWNRWGRPDGNPGPFDIYTYGAFGTTLPSYPPGLFAKVAVRVAEMQSKAVGSSLAFAAPAPSTVRRSRRVTARDYASHPINCRCGFTHEIACVHCDECCTWQHSYCYYGTETETDLPERHMCDDCQPDETLGLASLTSAMSKLIVQSGEKFSTLRKSERTVRNEEERQILGPFGLPSHDDIMWGPEDDETVKHLYISAAHLQMLARRLEPDLDIERLSTAVTLYPDVALLIEQSLGLDSQGRVEHVDLLETNHQLLRRRVLKAILAAALMVWVLEPRPSLDNVLVRQYQHEISKKNGAQILKSLHRTASVNMMESPDFEELLAFEAEEVAQRCWNAIAPMMASTEGGLPARIKQWKTPVENDRSNHELIVQAFSYAFRLKRYLPLSGKHFEFYAPEPGCRANSGVMTLEDRSDVEGSQTVKLCFAPAVIEYSLDIFETKESERGGLSGGGLQVKATAVQRAMGRLVTPAVVSVA